MSRLATRAEIDKLGQTLDVEPSTLAFLNAIPAEQLRNLRVAVYELMYRENQLLYKRLAAIASRLPVRTTLMFCERAGPHLTARVAAEMPSVRGAQVALRLPIPFWADVCAHLDPRRTRDLLARLPTELFVDVARELAARRDFMTMSRFVDFLSDDAIRAVEEAITDEGVLLRVAFYMGAKNRLDHLFRMLSPERMESMILRVEEDSDQLLAPFLSLLIHVSYGMKRELGDLAAAQDEEVLSGYVRGAHQAGLWADMLPVVAAMSETARQRVVNLPVLREAPVQESIIRAADEHRLWGIVLPMVEMMDEANRAAVAGIVAARGRETLSHATDAALMGEHWETLLDLARRMPASKQQELAGIVRTLGEVDPDLLARIEQRAEVHGLSESVSRAAG